MSRETPALSISFVFNTASSIIEDRKTEIGMDLRNGVLHIGGKSVKPDSLSPSTQNFAQKSNSIATRDILVFLKDAFAKAFQIDDPAFSVEDFVICSDTQQLNINPLTRGFRYTTGVCTTKEKGAKPEGTLTVAGSLPRLNRSTNLRITLSFACNNESTKNKINTFFAAIRTHYKLEQSIAKKLEANLINRFSVAFLLSAAATIPSLLFYLLPIFSGLGLGILPLAGLGAGISLASLVVTYMIVSGIYLLATRITERQTQITLPTLPVATHTGARVKTPKQLAAEAGLYVPRKSPTTEGAGATAARPPAVIVDAGARAPVSDAATPPSSLAGRAEGDNEGAPHDGATVRSASTVTVGGPGQSSDTVTVGGPGQSSD